MGEWKIFAGAVLPFSTLVGVGKIASSRKLKITSVGIIFVGLRHGDGEVTRSLGPYTLAWLTWLRKLAHGEAPALGSS